MPIKKKTTSVKRSIAARNAGEKKTAKASEKMTTITKTPSIKQAANKVGAMRTNLKNPRLWVGVAVIVIAVLLYVFKGIFVAAVVDGQPISRLAVVSALEEQNGKQALDNLVVEALVNQEAQKRHITVNQSDINNQIQQIENELKGQGVTLDSALAARGMTQSDLNDQLRLQELLNKMVGSSVTITDKQVQDYINQNKDSLPTNVSGADLQAQVKQQLEQQALQDKTQAFVSNLEKNAKITYFVNYPSSTQSQ